MKLTDITAAIYGSPGEEKLTLTATATAGRYFIHVHPISLIPCDNFIRFEMPDAETKVRGWTAKARRRTRDISSDWGRAFHRSLIDYCQTEDGRAMRVAAREKYAGEVKAEQDRQEAYARKWNRERMGPELYDALKAICDACEAHPYGRTVVATLLIYTAKTIIAKTDSRSSIND